MDVARLLRSSRGTTSPLLSAATPLHSILLRSTLINSRIVSNSTTTDVVIAPDLDARGISEITKGVLSISYEGFVELVEKHQVNSWL